MAHTTISTCLNHPGIEAVGRCKQCLKPVCGTCKVVGPVGIFCSTECKEKYEQFVERAAKLDSMPQPKVVIFRKVRTAVVRLIILAAVILVVGFAADMFGVNIPYLDDGVEGLKDLFGPLMDKVDAPEVPASPDASPRTDPT